MANVATMKRVFVMGSARLPDPDPDAAPDEALKLYRHSYPALAHCTLSEPREENGELVYEVQRPTQTTKGAGADAQRALAEVDQWERGQLALADQLADREVIRRATDHLEDCASRDSASPDDLASELIGMV